MFSLFASAGMWLPFLKGAGLYSVFIKYRVEVALLCASAAHPGEVLVGLFVIPLL